MDDQVFSRYFDEHALRNTPSCTDNIDYRSELEYRRDTVDFISDLAQHLGLLPGTCATATAYFHRFYMFHSFNAMPKYLVAVTSLYLAATLLEPPQNCDDFISATKILLDEKQLSPFKTQPKEELTDMKNIIMQTIEYKYYITHPYEFLLTFVQKFNSNHINVDTLTHRAWYFINDSLRTQLCLKYEPNIIACSALYLAAMLNKIDIKDWENRKDGETWWENFVEGITMYVISDVCHLILDLHDGTTQVEGKLDVLSIDNQSSTDGANGNSINNEPSSTCAGPPIPSLPFGYSSISNNSSN